MSAPESEPRDPEPASYADTTRRSAARSPRVLACVPCQQRRIKCDRKIPCASCIKSRSQCVQASLLPRQRRRRFPERELLERLRHYEDLLRRNNISFEPLHPDAEHDVSLGSSVTTGIGFQGNGPTRLEGSEPSPPSRSDPATPSGAIDLWHALQLKSEGDENFQDDYDIDDGESIHGDVMNGETVKMAMDHVDLDERLLFGSPSTDIDLTSSHPPHVQIFKLWQIYLDNVDPVLKVTHAPTMQASIIDAAGNLPSVKPIVEALLFGIYCVSILSLADDECSSLFAASKEELLARYQFGCQQALWRCRFLRTDDRHCLTALYLYLISTNHNVDRRSLASMVGLAVRIAQRMGIHNESANLKCTAFEAEMRRRLWWSLVIFDGRICESSNNLSSTVLIPTWDCLPPTNLNDSELRLEMKSLPASHTSPSEALYVVARSGLADAIRHGDFHLNFVNPVFKALASTARNGSPPNTDQLSVVEAIMEQQYLSKCDPEIPLHFLAICTVRSILVKMRLLKYYSDNSRNAAGLTDNLRDLATSYALRVIECESKIINSPLTKGYLWHAKYHFWFLAYIHIVHDLKKRPLQRLASKAWEVLSDDFKIRFSPSELEDNPFFALYAKVVLQAWEVREAAMGSLGEPLAAPWIVMESRRTVLPDVASAQPPHPQQQGGGTMSMNLEDFLPVPMDFGSQVQSMGTVPWVNSVYMQQAPVNFDVDQLDWNSLSVDPTDGRSW